MAMFLVEGFWNSTESKSRCFPRVYVVLGKEQVQVLVLCRPCCLGVPQCLALKWF